MADKKNLTVAVQGDDGFLITPSDSADISADAANTVGYPSCVVYIGGAGTMRVTTVKGTVMNFPGLIAGTILPVVVRRVHATGTTATPLNAVVGSHRA